MRTHVFFLLFPGAARVGALLFMTALLFSAPTFLTLGRYRVSPLARRLDCGAYTASVSIRSGRGQGTSDRVVRFAPRFATADSALRYALSQGRLLLDGSTLV